MENNLDYQAKRQSVINLFPQIASINEYEMVALLQEQFNHVEDELDIQDSKSVKNAFRLLTEENEELYEAIENNNFPLFRDAIGDQLTILYCLLFITKGTSFTGLPKQLISAPKNYIIYTDNVKKCHDALNKAYENKDLQLVQKLCYEYISTLITFPAGSAIDYRKDLLEITIASLSKICRNEEIAAQSLKFYQDLGYIVHIEKSEYGWVIMVTEDCMVDGKLVPKGKFRKSVEWMEAILEENPNETEWQNTMQKWNDLSPKAKLHIDEGLNPLIEDAETWNATLQVYKDITALKEAIAKAKA